MKIGIIGAMKQEISFFLKKMNNILLLEKGDCKIYISKLNNLSIFLVKSGIGKVSSAYSTTLLLDRFSPTLIFNIGTAGSLSSNLLSIGDVFIAEEAFYHDVNLINFGYQLGQMVKCPISFKLDQFIISKIKSIFKKSKKKVKFGKIASGDKFCTNKDSDYIQNNFPNTMAVDMESAAIAHVCYKFSTPLIIVRTISDIISEKYSLLNFKKFSHQSSIISSKITFNIIQKLC